MAKRKAQNEAAAETDAETQNVEPDAQHTFLVMDRIGPLEVGERAGQYLEAGERAFESDFAAESIARLVEIGVLAPMGGIATDVTLSTSTLTQFVGTLSGSAEGMEHGTDDSNGN